MTDQEFLFATMAMAEYCTNVMCRLSITSMEVRNLFVLAYILCVIHSETRKHAVHVTWEDRLES